MAASVWKRCATAAVKVKGFPPCFSGRRWLLSASYTDATLWEARDQDPQNLAVLANLMDRTYDRNLPVSSLTVSRFVDNISSREEVDQAEYYLYKFRHSPNCWYLRDWTVHGWIRQCLKYDGREKALHTIKNKVQYGIFPDDFTFNLLLDSYINDGDLQSACSVVEELMLQEAFDLRSTQILSMYALGCYLATRPQLTVSEERALGASLLLCGLKVGGAVGLNAQVLGNALLGKVEMLNGIHGVFKGMPLPWTRGYLGRALAVLERAAAGPGDATLCKDTLDYVSGVLQELSSTADADRSGREDEDEEERAKLPQYVGRFQELLESGGPGHAASFQALVTALAQQDLEASEKVDLEQYVSRVQAWGAEKKQLVLREKEMKEKAEEEKRQRLAAKAAAQQ